MICVHTIGCMGRSVQYQLARIGYNIHYNHFLAFVAMSWAIRDPYGNKLKRPGQNKGQSLLLTKSRRLDSRLLELTSSHDVTTRWRC